MDEPNTESLTAASLAMQIDLRHEFPEHIMFERRLSGHARGEQDET